MAKLPPVPKTAPTRQDPTLDDDDALDDFDALFAKLEALPAPAAETEPEPPPARLPDPVPLPAPPPLMPPQRGPRPAAPHAPATAPAAHSPARPVTRSTIDPLLGRSLLGFRLITFVGSGASSRVYRAEDADGVPAAVKVLNPAFHADETMRAGFAREAEVTERISHPSVLRVHACGEADGLVCIAFEYFDGVPVASLTSNRTPIDPTRAVNIVLHVVSALGALHNAGYVHRDVKPENILVRPADFGDEVKLCDFGHAASQDDLIEPSISDNHAYLAPELVSGARADLRSDLYACGVILFELLTGVVPETSDPELPAQLRGLAPDLSPILREVVLRALSPNMEDRHASAYELFEELRIALEPEVSMRLEFEPHALKDDLPVLRAALACLVHSTGEAAHAPSKEEVNALADLLARHGEITLARNDTKDAQGLAILGGHGEMGDLPKLLGADYATHAAPLVAFCVKHHVAALTFRDGADAKAVRVLLKTAKTSSLVPTELARVVNLLRTSDIISRGRGLSWKVGIAISRLANDLLLSTGMRGSDLRAAIAFRQELVERIAHVLSTPNDLAQMLANADIVDTRTSKLPGLKTFSTLDEVARAAPPLSLARACSSLLNDFSSHPDREARAHAALARLSEWVAADSSVESRKLLVELYRRSLLPPNISAEHVSDILYAEATADELSRDPSPQLDLLDNLTDRAGYAKALGELELAVEMLVDRGETNALVQVLLTIQRHAGQPSTRLEFARRDIAKDALGRMLRPELLAKMAESVLHDPEHLAAASTKALLLGKGAGAEALLRAQPESPTKEVRARFTSAMKAFGSFAFEAMRAEILRLRPDTNPADALRVEDMLAAIGDTPDDAMAEALIPLTQLPHLAGAALRACSRLSPLVAKPRLCLAVNAPDPKIRAMAIEQLGRHDLVDEALLPLFASVFESHDLASAPVRQAAAVALGDVKKALAPKAFALLVEASGAGKGLLNRLVSKPKEPEHPEVVMAVAQALARLDRAASEGPIKRLAANLEGIQREKVLKLVK